MYSGSIHLIKVCVEEAFATKAIFNLQWVTLTGLLTMLNGDK